MEVRRDDRCFVCGTDNPHGLGLRFELDRENRRASCSLRLDERYQGWEGIAHGGILSTLLDEAAIYACRCLGEHYVTAGLKVRFRKPVPVGEELELKAEVTGRRRRLLSVHAQVCLGGEVYAEAEVDVADLNEAAGAAGKDSL